VCTAAAIVSVRRSTTRHLAGGEWLDGCSADLAKRFRAPASPLRPCACCHRQTGDSWPGSTRLQRSEARLRRPAASERNSSHHGGGWPAIQPSSSSPARGGTEGDPRQTESFCYPSIERVIGPAKSASPHFALRGLFAADGRVAADRAAWSSRKSSPRRPSGAAEKSKEPGRSAKAPTVPSNTPSETPASRESGLSRDACHAVEVAVSPSLLRRSGLVLQRRFSRRTNRARDVRYALPPCAAACCDTSFALA